MADQETGGHPGHQLQLIRTRVGSSVPKPAMKFVYNRVGTDLHLEVGYYDLNELREAIEQSKARAGSNEVGEPVKVPLYVTDVFVLSPQGASDLFEVVQAMREDYTSNAIAKTAPADVAETGGTIAR